MNSSFNFKQLRILVVLIILTVVVGLTRTCQAQCFTDSPLITMFVDSLETLVDPTIVYDPTYRKLDSMCDDVPADIGVCSDVVIRAFAKIDICLAEAVNNYLKKRGVKTDRHIDHRRVRNLGLLFTYAGFEIPIKQSYDLDYYKPGDIIWWKLSRDIDHIGIVGKNGKVLHNIGQGQVMNVSPYAYRIHKAYRINV